MTILVAATRRVRWVSPLGPLDVWAHGDHLVRLDFVHPNGESGERWIAHQFRSEPNSAEDDDPLLSEAIRQLDAYFAGSRRWFDLPVAFHGTPFQRAVWQAVSAVPWGETRTYRAIAQEIGQPTAVRAVGAANGANPLSILVPCHRLVGSDGKLRGYGGGLERKEQLLALEGVRRQPVV